jgi:ATP synthase F0 subunit b
MSPWITWAGDFVGFLIVLFVLYRYVWPPVKKAMERQQEAIAKQIESEEHASQRLADAEKRYENVVAQARTESAKIRDAARADAERIVEEMKAQAEREVERIKQRGEEQLATERQQVVREVHAHVGALSAELAQRLVSNHLTGEGRTSASVDKFLDELEGMAGAEREQAAAGAAAKGGA